MLSDRVRTSMFKIRPLLNIAEHREELNAMSKSYLTPRKGGAEQDMLSRRARRLFCDSLVRRNSKKAKQSYNRRQRRTLKPAEED